MDSKALFWEPGWHCHFCVLTSRHASGTQVGQGRQLGWIWWNKPWAVSASPGLLASLMASSHCWIEADDSNINLYTSQIWLRYPLHSHHPHPWDMTMLLLLQMPTPCFLNPFGPVGLQLCWAFFFSLLCIGLPALATLLNAPQFPTNVNLWIVEWVLWILGRLKW